MRNRSIYTVILLCISMQTGIARGQDGPPPANVTIDEVLSEELVRRRSVTGEIRSRLTSALASQVEGLLIELDVEEGDEVTKGQIIARIDSNRAQIAVRRAESQLAFAQSVIQQRQIELDNASRDLDRIEQLDRLGSSGVSQLDDAQTLVESRKALLAQAESELATAQGDLDLAKRELEDMSIEAPFSGRVVEKHSEIGQWIGSGDEIVTIVSLDQLEARIDIPEDVYAAVSATMRNQEQIELRLPALGLGAGQEIYGEVITILPSADTLSRLFPVRIAVDNRVNTIRPGMSLNAMVPTDSRGQYITVHKDAIVRTATGEVVYFSSDGVSAIAPIERLFAIGERMAVRSPVLQAGMSVVISGNERLFPGQPLNILAAPKGPDVGLGKQSRSIGAGDKTQSEGN